MCERDFSDKATITYKYTRTCNIKEKMNNTLSSLQSIIEYNVDVALRLKEHKIQRLIICPPVIIIN